MNGIKADAEAHLASLSMENPEDIDRIYYYKAAIETCEGVVNYARRIAAHARELAAKEQNAQRRAELLTIADVNENVPANRRRPCREALQSIWTVTRFEIEERTRPGCRWGASTSTATRCSKPISAKAA